MAAVLLAGSSISARTINVPGDYPTIQQALDAAFAGDSIEVSTGTYYERVRFPRSGDSTSGSIVLRAAPGSLPMLDGTGAPGCDMVLIDSRSYVAIQGFEIRNALGVSDCSGVRVRGSGVSIEIRDNIIHDIRGTDAMGITVYGTLPQPIQDLVIDGNVVYDCEPATSEAITLNGNVTDFEVTRNVVRDVNNIGIDFIGGETSIQPDPTLVARNGLCRGNRVLRARSSYGGGFAAGIYVDGGRDIVIEGNVVSECDLGIEVAAENAGIITTRIAVRSNFVYRNDKVGIVFGGYDVTVGRANGNWFLNNTLYRNDTLNQGLGELWIQYAEGNSIRGNVFYGTAQNVLLYSEAGNVNNTLDYNLWYLDAGPGAAEFTWQGTTYTGFAAYRAATGQDASSLFVDPQLRGASAGDLHIAPSSPARDSGDPAFAPAPSETDIDGQARVLGGRVDIGADEIGGEDVVAGRGLGPPSPNEVRVHRPDGSASGVSFFAYAASAWGVNVAAGRIDGAATEAILTGPGPGPIFGPQVRSFDRAGSPLAKVNFYAYGTLRYGVNAVAGSLDADGFDEIISGAGPGAVFGPHVRGFNYDGLTLTAIAKVSFFAYGTLRYGVNACSAALDTDAFRELLTGPGPGLVFGPQVRGFNYDASSVTSISKINFSALPLSGYGINVASGDMDGDPYGELVVAAGPGPAHPSLVAGFNYDGATVAPLPGLSATVASTFYGARAGTGLLAGSGPEDLLAGAGRDPSATATVTTYRYDGLGLSAILTFDPFPGGVYGVNLAGGDLGY